jgi:hypothetical protein
MSFWDAKATLINLKTTMKVLILGILMLVGTLGFGQNGTKEVLMVDEHALITKLKGLYLYWEGKEPEKVAFDTNDPLEAAKIVATRFAKLYKDGWMLKDMETVFGCVRYVFERERG